MPSASAVTGASSLLEVQSQFLAQIDRLTAQVSSGDSINLKVPRNAVDELRQLAFGTVTQPSQQDASGVLLNGQHALSLDSTVATPPLASGFDPSLLEKSSTLVREEFRLRRGKIEQVLREQAINRRKKGFQIDKDAHHYDGPHQIDASEVLSAAQELVKPVSGLAPIVTKPAATPSSAIDENSYYSSRGLSWTSEEGEVHASARPHLRPHQNPGMLLDAAQVICSTSSAPEAGSTIGAVSGNSLPHTPCLPYRTNLEPNRLVSELPSSQPILSSREASYSPPPVTTNAIDTAPAQTPTIASTYDGVPQHVAAVLKSMISDTPTVPTAVGVPEIQYSSDNRSRESESPYSPPPPPTAFAGHGNLPLPQQPLSFPFPPPPPVFGLSNTSVGNGTAFRSEPLLEPSSKQKSKSARKKEKKQIAAQKQTAPSNIPQNIQNPRKRRRDDGVDLASKRLASDRHPVTQPSPSVPYIKPEPMSPRPMSRLHADNAPQSFRRLIVRPNGQLAVESFQDESDDADNISLQQAQPKSRRPDQTDSDAATEIGYRQGRAMLREPIPVQGRPSGQDYELRRAASVADFGSFAGAPPTAQHYTVPNRAASRLYSEQVAPRYTEILGDEEYMPTTRYRVVSQAPYDRHFRGQYLEDLEDRRMMPPPPPVAPPRPRRIFVDENGEEWIATPANPNSRASMARELPQGDVMPPPRYSVQPPSRRRPQVIEIEDDDEPVPVQRRSVAPSSRPRTRRVVYDVDDSRPQAMSGRQRAVSAYNGLVDELMMAPSPAPRRHQVVYQDIEGAGPQVARHSVSRVPSRAVSMQPFTPNAGYPQSMPHRYSGHEISAGLEDQFAQTRYAPASQPYNSALHGEHHNIHRQPHGYY